MKGTPDSSSDTLFERARQVIPGGVNSPVRAFRGVGGTPRFIERGEGAFIYDVEGRRYIDYLCSWGAHIFGHGCPDILESIAHASARGTSFGAPTRGEIELAEEIVAAVPELEMVRLVNSGTEATMTAIRLARAFTDRPVIIKCNGCYHGHADPFLVAAGSGVATLSISGSPGVPDSVAGLTAIVEFNDIAGFSETIQKIGAKRVAAFILEPVPGNMGMVLPQPGYLKHVRELCSQNGIVLILDEVMSGFRVAYGGAAERYSVAPDLVTYGKIIGGGLPVGAVAGRREIMKLLAPEGPVYQAGTLSGNPLAVAAGLTALRLLKEQNPYSHLEDRSALLAKEITSAVHESGLPFSAVSCGGMFGLWFRENPPQNFTEAKRTATACFPPLFHALLEEGIYIAPSAFEANFIGTLHDDEILEQTIVAFRRAAAKIAQSL